jgi:hypothetical protein
MAKNKKAQKSTKKSSKPAVRKGPERVAVAPVKPIHPRDLRKMADAQKAKEE